MAHLRFICFGSDLGIQATVKKKSGQAAKLQVF